MPFEESDELVGQHLGATEIMNVKCFSAQAPTLLGSGILGKYHGDAWKQLRQHSLGLHECPPLLDGSLQQAPMPFAILSILTHRAT